MRPTRRPCLATLSWQVGRLAQDMRLREARVRVREWSKLLPWANPDRRAARAPLVTQGGFPSTTSRQQGTSSSYLGTWATSWSALQKGSASLLPLARVQQACPIHRCHDTLETPTAGHLGNVVRAEHMHVCHDRQGEARRDRAGQDKAVVGRPPAAGALKRQSEPTPWHPHTHPHKHVSKNINPALHPAPYRHTTLRTTRYVPTSHLTSRSPLQFAALGVMQQFRSAALVLSGTFSAPSVALRTAQLGPHEAALHIPYIPRFLCS